MLKIVDFTEHHIERAVNIAKANYESERKCIDILPEITELPDFSPFSENGLGVSAFDGEKMIGYLCCYNPFKNAFGTTNAIGVWSPVHGNGMIENDYKNTFAGMYQEAAKKWVDSKAVSHAITFYSHKQSIQHQLYRYGFGLRCIDAVREMKEIDVNYDHKYYISELGHNEFHLIFPLALLLDDHLAKSPIFMRHIQAKTEVVDEYKFAEWQMKEDFRYFTAKDGGKIVAYIKVTDKGENFVGDAKNMKHVCGAFCLPEYRGQGIIQSILNFIIKILRNENNQLLGVDFESFNPTGSNFWLKYFTEYTHGVVRRIDDLIIESTTAP
jgi:GNAT superfamily N-acetyltransferase